MAWLKELKRRKVVQTTGVYLMFAWAASIGLADLLPAFDAPPWMARTIIVGLFSLVPVVAMLAWYYELTGKGVVRDPADRSAAGNAQPSALQSPEVPASGVACESADTMVLQGISVLWHDGAEQRVEYLSEDFTLGRDPSCDICVSNPLASRSHARVSRTEQGWQLVDLNSRNGTLVDGDRVSTKRLHTSHSVRLGGGTPIELHVLD